MKLKRHRAMWDRLRIASVFKLPVALVNERLGKTIVHDTRAGMAVPKIACQSLPASVS
jgi:hypothetical protein